jgi:hypothetical protein
MVSCAGELFRRSARDETFGLEMAVISMIVELERLQLIYPSWPGFVPAIHVFLT